MSIDCSPVHFLACPAQTEIRRTTFIPTSFLNIAVIVIIHLHSVASLFHIFSITCILKLNYECRCWARFAVLKYCNKLNRFVVHHINIVLIIKEVCLLNLVPSAYTKPRLIFKLYAGFQLVADTKLIQIIVFYYCWICIGKDNSY